MSPADKHDYDEQLLTRYLLGGLSDEEAERTDERTIIDRDFASHLDDVENDLVDAYVRGELSGETLDRFKRFYLRSPKRLAKVEFSRALLHFSEKSIPGTAQVSDIPSPRPPHKSPRVGFLSGWLGMPRWGLQWGSLGAMVLMLFAVSFLLVKNARLRKQAIEAHEQQIAMAQRAQELERQITEQRSANAGVLKELERLRESAPAAQSLRMIAVLLLPPTRGPSQSTTVSLPPGTDGVTVRLQLESDDFPMYRVALRDPAMNQIVWRSPKLKAKPEGPTKVVSISLPASLLKQQNYVLELTGVRTWGAGELLSSYSFKVVLE